MSSRVVIVEASAGWGKTTAVDGATAILDPLRVDLARAPRETGALAFALAQALGIGSSSLGAVLRQARSSSSAVPLSDWLRSHAFDASFLAVIDDLHLLRDDRLSLDFLALLVDLLPSSRWILVSRHSLMLPTASWLAYGVASLPVGEDDLMLSADDVRPLLAARGQRCDPAAVAALLSATGGWPVAVRFFLTASERSEDLLRISTMTKEIAFVYLAEQVFNELPSDRKDLLVLLAFAGACDSAMLESLGVADPFSAADWLRTGPIPVREDALGLRLHDLFGEFVRRSAAAPIRKAAALRASEALRMRGRSGEALDLCRSQLQERVPELLRLDGFGLLDAGLWETVEHALQLVPIEARRSEAAFLGLRAASEAGSGGFDRAEALYLKGIAACAPADRDLHSSLSRRLSLFYINRAQDRSVDTIRPVLAEGSERNRCEARSVYAMALAITGSAEASSTAISEALDAAESIADDRLSVRIRMRAAWVAFHCGDYQRCEREALLSARLAGTFGDWSTYTLAQSTLCSCMLVHRDDQALALWHAQQMALGARRSGNRQLLSFALWAQFHIEVDRARRDRIEILDAELDDHPNGLRDGFFARYSCAVRLGWSGLFADALRRLDVLDGSLHDPSERRAWSAAMAMFNAFAGRDGEAKRHLSECSRPASVPVASSRHYETLAGLCAAFADIFIGRPSLAVRRLPPSPSREQDRALDRAARAISRVGLSPSAVSPILVELRSSRCEGFADLLSAAIASRPDDVRVLSLTESELWVLRSLDAGSSPKRIAESTDRSIETVRNHIKSAVRKLGASGSREAVSAARRLGAFDP